jgi:hypothetical protein
MGSHMPAECKVADRAKPEVRHFVVVNIFLDAFLAKAKS